MRWLRRNRPTNTTISVSDPLLIELFGLGAPNYAGVNVSEQSALGVSAFWRGVSLISGTIAGLPLRTIRNADGVRTRISSFLDDPGAHVGLTKFQWTETVVAHLVVHGNCFLLHVYNGAGSLAGLTPIHPSAVTVEWDDTRPGGKKFTASLADGRRVEYDARTLTHVMGLSLDGLRGLSLIEVARNGLGTAIAGDRAAARMFSNGALHVGLVTADEDLGEEEAKAIKASLDAKVSGVDNAGGLAVINRKLSVEKLSMSNEDAQFLESRQFSVQDVARWLGVPANLLMDPGSVSTWGTGVEIQNRGLAKFTLAPYTSRIEQALSRLLPSPRFAEFDFAGLERPTPEQEIRLLIEQVDGGLLTVNEARHIRNLPPVEGGDVLRGTADPSPASDASPEAVPA